MEPRYRYKTEEILERNIPFNQLEEIINQNRTETVKGNKLSCGVVDWELFSHNVVSRLDKQGEPEIVHYLIFRTSLSFDDDMKYAFPEVF